MKTLILLLGVAVMLGLAACASEADHNDHNARDNHSGAPDSDTTDHNHPLH